MGAQVDSTVKDFNPLVGNYLKAAKYFNPGDAILIESPTLFGPNHVETPVCLECLKITSDQCSKCSAALCSNHETLAIHDEIECDLLHKAESYVVGEVSIK